MMTGNAMIARVNQPAIMETPQSKKRTNMPNPKRPRVMDGTPERLSTDSRIGYAAGVAVFAQVDGTQYAEVRAMAMEPATSRQVPMIAGPMPPPL